MSHPLRVASSRDGESPDPELDRLIDELTRRLQAGEALDEPALLAAHPEHAEALRRLLPALVLLADLGCTVVTATSSAPRPLDTLAEGDRLGRFHLIRELKRGGMGVVFKATQGQVSRPVAIKMILAGRFATDADLRRFRAEAEAVSRLDHPNIVPVYEVGEEAGRPYFSMKFCPGGSLDDHPDRYRGAPEAAARVVALVARAVHHAHRRGILHRDLKPSNILIDADGRPLVADFGLARVIDEEHDLTRTGDLLGSPPYMAPEQADGRRGDVTVATDVYGLGAVLYALLAGRPPFRGDSPMETIDRVRHQEPEPPVGPDGPVDRDLRTVCLKCLAKDPSQRYASAAELADDLDRWLRGEPTLARPASPAHRLSLWARRPERIRDAGWFGLVLGVLMTLYASTGVAMTLLGRLDVPRPDAFLLLLLTFIGVGYVPLAAVGLATLQGRRWAIPVGIAQGLLGSAVFIAHEAGVIQPDTGGAYTNQDPVMMTAYHLFLLTLTLTLAALYMLAMLADRTRHASKPSRTLPATSGHGPNPGRAP